MAIRPLNSVAGFSVGETPANIILANGDITTTNITLTGVSNLNSIGNVKITGGTGGQVISTDGSGNLSFVTISTSGLTNGTSNINVLNSGNITFSVAGSANVGTFTGTGLNVSGTLNATGNANVGNLGTGRVLATANVTAPQLISNVSTGTAPLVVSSTTLVSNLNADLLDGFNTATANTANTVVVRDTNGNVSANFFIGDGSQLTGIGDAASIANGTSNVRIPSVNGNVTIGVAGNANVATFTGTGVNVAGNLEANVVKTDNLFYANGSPWDFQEPAGANNQIQFNSNGNFGASANFAFDDTNNTLTVTGANANILVGNSAFGTTIVSDSIQVGNLDPFSDEQAFINKDGFSLFGNAFSGNVFANLDINGIGYQTDTGYVVLNSFGLEIGEDALSNSQVYIYSNGAIAATNSNDTSFSADGDSLQWFTSTNAGFQANANVATHTSKLQAPVIESNVATGTAPFIVTSTTQVANLNVATAGSATTAGTVTNAAQPNITSVGTLTSLGVTGTISSGNANLGNAVTANFFIGSGNNLSSIQGANVTGTVPAATIAGTVTTATQPNITSVGILSSLTVTGNVSSGNLITGGIVTATGNVTGGNLTTAGTLSVTGNANVGNIGATGVFATTLIATGNASAGNISTTGTLSVIGNANVGNIGATGVFATTLGGTLTTAAQPNITSVGTLSSLSVTGNANVGNIGAINAVFTGTGAFGGNVAMGNFNITGLADPINQQDAATKVYVDEVAQGLKTRTAADAYSSTNLTSTYNNGTSGVGATLTATANGVFPQIDGVTLNTTTTRRLLVAGQTNKAHNGLYVLIDEGSVSTPWILRRCVECDTAQEIPGSYVFINGGNVYANTGWVASVVNPATFVVGTDAINWIQFSGAGTFTAGTGLTLTGTVFSVNASQTQVTSVGTLTGLNSSGTITAPNITANTGVFTGNGAALTNLNASNISTGTLAQARLANSNVILGNTTLALGTTTTTIAGLSSVTSTTFVGSLTGAATTAGTVTTSAQPNITSVGTLTSLTVTGTATAGNLSTGGTLSVTGNANVGNLGTGGLIIATGNVTGGNLTTAGVVAATGNVSGGNITTAGALSVTGNASVGNLSATNGNLTTANVSGSLILGNSSVTTAISYGSVTTTTITANQTIASFSSTGVTGVEFLVKSVDSTGSKYGVATVVAVTDGTSVDYSTFATVNLGGYTGALAVNISGGFVRLQVTPASSNSTVWTTQYRLI